MRRWSTAVTPAGEKKYPNAWPDSDGCEAMCHEQACTLRAWWPNADLQPCVLTGARTGLYGLDIDGPPGIEVAKRYLLDTALKGFPCVQTKRDDGYHFLFRARDGEEPLGRVLGKDADKGLDFPANLGVYHLEQYPPFAELPLIPYAVVQWVKNKTNRQALVKGWNCPR